MKLYLKVAVIIIAFALAGSGAYAGYFRLQTQLNDLRVPSMDGTFTFTGGGCFFGCSATVRGAWVNHGTQNARSVVVTLTWSNAGTFVQTNTINVGVVAGRSIGLIPDTSYTLSSQADTLDWSFTFTA